MPSSTPPIVEALIEELRRDGTPEEAGHFSLDREKMKEKTRRYQLADPNGWVLQLVQAAVLKEATFIDFDIDPEEVRMVFDGRPFTVEDFELLYDSLFRQVRSYDDWARQELALGLNAAMGRRPTFLRVVSGDASGGAELELRPDEGDRFQATAPPEVPGTVIHFKGRPGLRVVDLKIMDAFDTLPIERLLRERCRFADIPITVDGKRVSGGLRIEDGLAEVDLDGPETTGRGAFVTARDADGKEIPSRVDIVINGVLITSHVLSFAPGSFVAVVASRRLLKDLSQAEVVDDRAYQTVLERVRAAREESAIHLCRELVYRAHDAEKSNRIRQILRQACRPYRQAKDYMGRDATELARALATARIWEVYEAGTGRRGHYSLEQLREREASGWRMVYWTGDPDDKQFTLSAGVCVLHRDVFDDWFSVQVLQIPRLAKPRVAPREEVIKTPSTIGVCFMFIAVLGALASTCEAIEAYSDRANIEALREHGEYTEGQVTAVSGGEVFIRYTVGGKPYTTSRDCTDDCDAYKLGKPARVVYLPDRPKVAHAGYRTELLDWGDHLSQSVAMLVGGVFLFGLLYGIDWMRYYFRRRRRAAELAALPPEDLTVAPPARGPPGEEGPSG